MRLLVRSRDRRFRGSAHALRSAYTHFTLVEPFPNGKMFFKRIVDRPVCVYVIADKLFILSDDQPPFTMTPIGGGRFHLERDGRFYSPGDYLDDDTCVPTKDWPEGRAWEAFRLVDAPRLDRRESLMIERIDLLLGRRPDGPQVGDEIAEEVHAYLASTTGGGPAKPDATHATTHITPHATTHITPRGAGTADTEVGRGFAGCVDVCRRSYAAGWAARDRESTVVSVFVNDVRVGEAHGTGERPDVMAAGFARNSAWSFAFPTPLGIDDRVAFRFPDGAPMRRTAGGQSLRLGSAHTLRSAFNHFTLCDCSDGALRFRRVADRPVCVYVVDNKLFVLAAGLQSFIVTAAEDESFHLRNATDGRLFSLGLGETEDTFRAAADRIVADAWEIFELRPALKLDRREQEIMARIDRMIDRCTDPGALANLADEFDAPIVGAILTSTTPCEEARAFAGLTYDQPLARSLARSFPRDAHAKALLRLLDGEAATEKEIAVGDLWLAGLDGSVPSLPFALNCRARQLRRPTRKTCILATLRDEAPYIVEWLAYHRSIGIERFFVYENDSQDGSRELVDRLADHGLIDVVHNVVAEGGNAQSSAYAHALSLRSELLDYEWCGVVDLDEFLLLNDASYTTIDDFLAPFDERAADAIAVNWVVYGPNGRLQRDPTRSIMETFTWRFAQPDRHIKSIIRPQKFFTSSAHYPCRYRAEPFDFVDTLGRPHAVLDGQTAWSARPDESRLALAHYVYKSLDEFLLKWSRNRGDNPRRRDATNKVLTKEALEAFINVFDERAAAPPTARSTKAAAEARRIRALPGIAAIEQAAEARYRCTIGGIREMFLDCPASSASTAGPRFRELVRLAATRAEI